MVDAHIHAPQYAFTGTGYDRPLLDWASRNQFILGFGQQPATLYLYHAERALLMTSSHSKLNTYTFPVEANFTDPEFAKQVYSKVVARLISNGTTTACYFGTIDRYVRPPLRPFWRVQHVKTTQH